MGVLSSKPDLGSSLGALQMELGAVGIPALWGSAVTDVALDVSLKAQSFAPKLLQTKPSVLCLAAGAGCRRMPICAEGEAISTDSLLHHLLLLAETSTSRLRGPWQSRALAVRGWG